MLTAKQARFATLVARGATQANAYRQAYESQNMTPNSVRVEASKLAKRPAVREAIKALQAEDAIVLDATQQLSEEWTLNRLRTFAENNAVSPSVRVRALEIIAKILGMFKDRREIVVHRPVAEIEAELNDKIEEMFGVKRNPNWGRLN